MKKSFIYILIISVVFIFTRCSAPQEPLVIKSSIDEISGWITRHNTFSEINAHSGKVSSKIDSLNQYSFAYEEYLKNMNRENISKIRFSAWVLVENIPSSVTLVGALGDGTNAPLAWIGLSVKDKILKANEWTRIEGEIIVPENYADNIKFGCYLYSPIMEVAYVDDFEIIVE
jgi:hypothetical protein